MQSPDKWRGGRHARRLLRLLSTKQRILITSHIHPDPDALASCFGIYSVLTARLPGAEVHISIKGQIGGGINDAFTRHTALPLTPWSDTALANYDAIILLDAQPAFAYSPLPANVIPTAVIDHHAAPGRRPRCTFRDIRPEVGATASIVFSYFMELDEKISPELGATLLYGIESDLAGAAGLPNSLDNMALSGLTLIADTAKLYQMRYVDLPQEYFVALAASLATATYYEQAMISHLGTIQSLEKPAIAADLLLRYEGVQWSLATAISDRRLVLSLRTNNPKLSAGELMRRLLNNIGQGGGHRTKAGGFILLDTGSTTEIERVRNIVKRRLLRALQIPMSRGQKLVQHPGS